YQIRSNAVESQAQIVIIFNFKKNMSDAADEIRNAINSVRYKLPTEMREPVIRRQDPSAQPVIEMALSSTSQSHAVLSRMAEDDLADRLRAIDGVATVTVTGSLRRELSVLLRADRLREYGISVSEVVDAVRSQNANAPVGRVVGPLTEESIRLVGRIENPADFQQIIVRRRGSEIVRLGQLAETVDGFADVESHALRNGRPNVSLSVTRSREASTVAVAARVRKLVGQISGELPPGTKLEITNDGGKDAQANLNNVIEALALGALLTIVVVYVFLNSWRSTLITALSLPTSVITAFIAVWMCGFTLNMMTLLGLSLAIGVLIDDAIVVRENIVRHLEMGKDHHTAAREGTSEIGLAVFSTTLAVMAVFIPVAFMGGMIGKIFFQFGVTVAFAVLVSLFVSFTLDPMLSSIWPDPEVERRVHHRDGVAVPARKPRNPVVRFAHWFNDRFEAVAERYPRWLRWALGHRVKVMTGAVGSIVAAIYVLPLLGFTWMPDFDGGEFNVGFRAPPGSRLEYTIEKGREIDSFLRRQPEVAYTYMSIGGGFRGTPSNGQIFVKLKNKEERSRSQEEIQTALRGELRRFTGVRANISGTPTIFGGRGQPIQVNVQGPEFSTLQAAADQVLAALRTVPGVAEPQSAQEDRIPQLEVVVDRQRAWAAGVGIESIGSTLQPLFTGQRATRWEDPQGYSHDVIVVYPDSLRTSAADVANIPVPSSNVGGDSRAAMIPLSEVADVRSGTGPVSIERRSLERQITIGASVLPGFAMGDVAASARAAISQAGLPAGYRTVFTGDVQNLEETKGYVGAALLLAVVFIYLILASLFGSFLQPLAIMLALPLSFLGVAGALWITGGNLNVMTMIGIIMLMGLVTKNGILLVDFVNQQRAQGMARNEAVLMSGRVRLRPIIMTTMAMIFGMIPLALALGEGAEQRAPMAHAVMGGLVTSTLLTLFVVPVVYTLFDDFVRWIRPKPELAPVMVRESEVAAAD
ncbi:MAG: efflux RND transporter permease subunit, partial [Longimicrobiaceae bacterium]